jgi:cell wall-associated NlpC family hydrolase
MISAAELIRQFRHMAGWKYVWGAAREGAVDCSGAFTLAFKRLGSWMYHGSNTMYTTYSYDKGEAGAVPVLPGMAVYKYSKLTKWHHVGLYVGGGLTIEAKGALYGVIYSRLEDWSHTGKLRSKNGEILEYDVVEAEAMTYKGLCRSNSGGPVNMRTGCAKLNSLVAKVPNGAEVQVLDIEVNDGWNAVRYDGKIGFMMSEFVALADPIPTVGDRLTALESKMDAFGQKLAAIEGKG